MRRRLRPVGLRSTLCYDLTTLPARSASAALRGGAPPPALCRSLGRPLPAGAVSDDRLPHAARQPSGGRCASLCRALYALAPRRCATRRPLRRRADARRLRAVGLRVTHATRAEVARARVHLPRSPATPVPSRWLPAVVLPAAPPDPGEPTSGVPPCKAERYAHVPRPVPFGLRPADVTLHDGPDA